MLFTINLKNKVYIKHNPIDHFANFLFGDNLNDIFNRYSYKVNINIYLYILINIEQIQY